MNNIGFKIKELRKKKDITQEKLAKYLNVSFQAVSKWETGIASPDLAMIVPLARLFEVSTDELFGVAENAEDTHKKELFELWNKTWKTGDVAERYEISKIAVAEYPGNFEYLKWLADTEDSYAIHNCERNSEQQKEHFENAIKYYEMIIEDCDNTDLKEHAIYRIVMTLSSLNRRDEALQYAKQHPSCDELLKCCLRGEEWEEHRQKMIFRKLCELVVELECGKHDIVSIQAAEKIIKTVIDDGNYLMFHDTLMFNCIWQAQCFTKQKRYEEAVAVLRKSHEHAVMFEEMLECAKKSPLPYTCRAFNKLFYDAKDYCVSGTTTKTEDFKDCLAWKEFDGLRERDDFKELLEL